MKEEAIIVENIQYESLAALARAYGINKSTIYKRHQRNKKGDELIPFKYRNKNHESREQSNESELSFCVGTLKFKTVSEACRKLNVSRGSYHARKRYGWSDEEA